MNDEFPYDVFNEMGEHVAQVKWTEEAAMLVSVLGKGSSIRWKGNIVYVEGTDGTANISYDYVADIVATRIGKLKFHTDN